MDVNESGGELIRPVRYFLPVNPTSRRHHPHRHQRRYHPRRLQP